MAKRKTPAAQLRAVRKWRAPDQHTGIDVFDGIAYTYEHISTPPKPGAEVYRIETYIPFLKPTPLHRNVRYVAASGDVPSAVETPRRRE